jgi:hypothetical protein
MTSLGYLQYSEINDNSAINSNTTEIEKKKQARHNITIKKRHEIHGGGANGINVAANTNNDNVQNMLKLINNSNGYDNDGDDSSGLVDFNPPPRAEVSSKIEGANGMGANGMGMGANGISKDLQVDFEKPSSIIHPDAGVNNTNSMMAVGPRQYPVPLDSYEGFNSLPKTYASDYYKQYVPYFNQSGSSNGDNNSTMNKNQILEKLNYMIHLLEEQKDEKTGHVMEEVILYSFLGVFIIFIVDSFARVGKYTR